MRSTPFIMALSMVLLSTAMLTWADENDLDWSTFLGGSSYEEGCGIALSGSKDIYLTGKTGSTDFPTTVGAFDTTYNDGGDLFIARLNATGNALGYATYLGGAAGDHVYDIAMDGLGNAYVVGYTYSSDFPTTTGAFDTTHNGGLLDAFVAKLNATGDTLVYSTFLGGSNGENGYGIAVDSLGNAHVAGNTWSTDFPTTDGAFDTTMSELGCDVFIAKLNPLGSALDYATFLGEGGSDYGYAIVLDGHGDAYIAGYTESSNFPTTSGAFDTTHNGRDDVFVAKLNLVESILEYSTYLGGSSVDRCYGGLTVDIYNNVYITGCLFSADFPVTAGAFDETYNGDYDVFVAKLNDTGSNLDYATFLGGSHVDLGYDIAVDISGRAYVVGHTFYGGFPTTAGAFDTTLNGSTDAFVVKLNATGSALDYATFLGGNNTEKGLGGIAVDGSDNVWVAGQTFSTDFPTTDGVFDTTLDGSSDVFVAKFDLSGYPVPVVLASFEAIGGQGFIKLNWITASEVNCHRWEIYRSNQKEGAYNEIGRLVGYGSTETAHAYEWIDRRVSPETIYFYKLKQVDFDGSFFWSHVVSATPGPTMPKSYSLSQNYPNPFNARTEFRYQIPADDRVTLKIFNTLGQEVRTLVDTQHEAGEYQVRWDGRDDHGYEVSAGIYFCTMKAGEFIQTRKMVLLR